MRHRITVGARTLDLRPETGPERTPDTVLKIRLGGRLAGGLQGRCSLSGSARGQVGAEGGEDTARAAQADAAPALVDVAAGRQAGLRHCTSDGR